MMTDFLKELNAWAVFFFFFLEEVENLSSCEK